MPVHLNHTERKTTVYIPSDTEWALLKSHQDIYNFEFTSKNKEPKLSDWRVMRFCTQDILLGVVVARYNPRLGVVDVDVALTYDPEALTPWTGTKMVLITLLSLGFQSGSSMEIRFTSIFGTTTAPVGKQFIDIANHYGVELKHALKGHISSSEARKLYFEVTDLSAIAKQKALELHRDNKITIDRVAYMIHHGVWDLEEMEMILLGSDNPERVLLGSINPMFQAVYALDMMQTRGALLGTLLSNKLLNKQVEESEEVIVIQIEGDEKQFEVTFDPRFYSKVYLANERVSIPWIIGGKELYIEQGEKLLVLIRPRDEARMRLFMSEDLTAIHQCREAYPEERLAILYPKDFLFLETEIQEDFKNQASQLGCEVLLCPEMALALEISAIDTLERSKLIRR